MQINITIKLSVIFGIISCAAWYILAKNLGFYSVSVYLFRFFFILGFLLIGIFISVFLNKKKNNGFIEFKEALKVGMLYAVTFALIMAIFNYLYHTFITPDTIDYFLSEAKKAAMAHHVKISEIPDIIESERKTFSSFRLVPPILFWGLISSLLAGAILQKHNPNNPIIE
jgi:hypothetical protein